MTLTLERLKELLHYDPETGVFTRRVRRSNSMPGTIAGTLLKTGHISISIDSVQYLASRLAVLYMTGEWPKDQVDHVNMNTQDNRYCNLRGATQSENLGNRRVRPDSSTGVKGVFPHHKSGRFRAKISYDNIQYHIGYYDTVEKATEAYRIAAEAIFGKFARVV